MNHNGARKFPESALKNQISGRPLRPGRRKIARIFIYGRVKSNQKANFLKKGGPVRAAGQSRATLSPVPNKT
jgi:hypothetical protein